MYLMSTLHGLIFFGTAAHEYQPDINGVMTLLGRLGVCSWNSTMIIDGLINDHCNTNKHVLHKKTASDKYLTSNYPTA